MIVVDSSALIAIFFDEPEKQVFEDIIAGGERCAMSAVNAHEAACVLRVRQGPQAVERLWQLLAVSEIEIVPFDETQVRAAAVAFDRYGKSLHPKGAAQSCGLRRLRACDHDERLSAVQGR